MASPNLERFFNPRSVVVVGASGNPSTVSGRPLRYLLWHRFPGKVYPVNPKYDEILGYPCFKAIEDIPESPDLAIIVLPAELVPESLERCGKKGTRFAIVLSSGFAEIGQAGERLQQRMQTISQRYGIRVCGPNCIGMVNVHDKVFAGFSPALEMEDIKPGPVSLISQSGAVGFNIFSMAVEAGIGFRYIVSTGNEGDLTALDYLEHFIADDMTKIIAMYIETIRQARRFLEVAEMAASKAKPIVALKIGRSDVGRRAALSHTAALAGSYETYIAAFKQAGVIQVDDIDELVATVGMLARCPLPRGRRVAILSSSGGAGILAADLCTESGLLVPELSGTVRASLQAAIPSFGSALNPIDVTGQILADVTVYNRCLDVLFDANEVDSIIMTLSAASPEVSVRTANAISQVKSRVTKPLVVAWSAGASLVQDGMDLLKEAGIPVYRTLGECVGALARVTRFAEGISRGRVHRGRVVDEKRKALAISIIRKFGGRMGYREAVELLSLYRIPFAEQRFARDLGEAISGWRAIAKPVALKIDSPDISHKTESRGVRLGLVDQGEVEEAYHDIIEKARAYDPTAEIRGVTVQEMVSGGVGEVILGAVRDPHFGPLLLCGLGGVHVEILKEVTLRVIPVTEADAWDMVKELRMARMLDGFRGLPVADKKALVELILEVSTLVVELEDYIDQLDLNPVIVLPEGQGVKVVDALIVCRESSQSFI